MENKLTIEHLAPYIPHKISAAMLDCKIDYVNKAIDTIVGIHQWDHRGELWCVLTEGGSKPGLDRIKPILKPLSWLIKEIAHNGQRFVPMNVLKNGGTDINELKFLEWKGYSAIDNEEHETCYDPDTMSFCQYYRGDSRVCSNQLNKFQKLFEWHFDVFGLIDSGLAIEEGGQR